MRAYSPYTRNLGKHIYPRVPYHTLQNLFLLNINLHGVGLYVSVAA